MAEHQKPKTSFVQLFTGKTARQHVPKHSEQPIPSTAPSPTTTPPTPTETSPSTALTQNSGMFTCEQAIDHIGLGRFHGHLFVVLGLFWLADAMEMLLLSFIGPALRCEWNISDMEVAALTTVVFVGMVVGSVVWGRISDKHGRRKGFLFSATFIAVFGVLCGVMPTFGGVLFCRLMVGFGVGGVPIAYSLLMEFMPSKTRGPLGIAFCVFWSIGGMIEAGLAWLIMPRWGWRWLVIASALPTVFLLCIFRYVPESPRFWLAKNKYANCVTLLQSIANDNRSSLPKGELFVPNRQTMKSTTTSQEAEEKPRIGLWAQVVHSLALDTLLLPGLKRITILLWICWFIAAFCYYGVVLITTVLYSAEDEGKRCSYFAKPPPDLTFFSPPEDSADCVPLSEDNYMDVFFTTSGEMPGLLLAIYFVQKFGRIRTVIFGCVMQALCSFFLIPCTTRAFENALLFFLRASSIGYYQAVYLFTGEVYPTFLKATAMGYCSTMARFGGILTPYAANVLASVNTGFALGLYGTLSIVCCVVVLCLPFDTKGLPIPDTVAEIQARVAGRSASKKPREVIREPSLTDVGDANQPRSKYVDDEEMAGL